MKPTLGRIVLFRTDGRNGLVYDLPAMITVTRDTHPGDYPDGSQNPLPVPESDTHVHLTVFTPGGFGSVVESDMEPLSGDDKSKAYVGADTFKPGSGTYVEWNVPFCKEGSQILSRSWRWPVITPQRKEDSVIGQYDMIMIITDDEVTNLHDVGKVVQRNLTGVQITRAIHIEVRSRKDPDKPHVYKHRGE